jgi:hypothetical protein
MAEMYEFPCPYCDKIIQETKRRGSWKRCPACNERFKIPPEPPPPFDATPYGFDFAEHVASHLIEKKQIADSHRDDCGMGFFFQEDQFIYTKVYDGAGEFWNKEESESYHAFPNRDQFVSWLAQQSDAKLGWISRAWIESHLANS